MRFPIYSLGIFLFFSGITLAAWLLMPACPIVEHDFRCTGWLANYINYIYAWCEMSMLVMPLLFLMALWRLMKWKRHAGGTQEVMHFPVYSIGIFVVSVVINMAVGITAEHNCTGSFGSYHCAGWVSAFDGFILLWQLYFLVLFPLVGLVALVRVLYWLITRRNRHFAG
jgi:hypothetical protein